MDLAGYRRSAEGFVSELTDAYYRHYAGIVDEYELEPIYERHAELFGRGAVEELHELLDAAPRDGEDHHRLRMLYDFAVEGFVGQATKTVEAELARREAALELDVDGEQIGFRQSAVVQANERSASRRAAIEQQRLDAIEEHLNPLYRELVGEQHGQARALGYVSYRDMCEQCKGIDLPALQTQTDAFATATDSAYPGVLEPELRRTLDVGLDEFRRSDLARFFRAAEQDAMFGAGTLVESLLQTLNGLGIGEQANVILDVEPRPNKSPRAFCAPVRVPQEVYLVIAPIGGRDDYSALFHESGHTEHYAHVDPDLPFEFRYLGDNSVTEAFAFLFQHLVDNPMWLERQLDIEEPFQLVSYARAQKLMYLRRYSAKLAYEVELHDGRESLEDMPDRYAALLGRAFGIPWSGHTFLADVDSGFYSACYLRAWALETHLRAYLQEQFGATWFESPEAGAMLRRLWREGQRSTPEELLASLSGATLDFGVLLEDLSLR